MEESDSSTAESIWTQRKTIRITTPSKIVMYSESELNERSRVLEPCVTAESESETPKSKDSKINENHSEHKSSKTKYGTSSSMNSSQNVMGSKYEIIQDKNIINYDGLILTQEEENGFLTDRIIASGLSGVSRCSISKGYVYTKLHLLHKNLSCITLLQCHRYLQVIDLSHNRLEDISALGAVRYLQELDVSFNLLTIAPGFAAPLHLYKANFSHNLITDLVDFADFSLLQSLNLSRNYINNLNDLHTLRYLENLDLSYNDIDSLEKTSHLCVYNLNLEGNPMISRVYSDVPVMKNIKHLNLNFSLLQTVYPLKEMYMLQELEVRNNRLNNLVDINYLKGLTNLVKLDLRENVVTSWRKYRQYVISLLPTLCFLDGKPVSWMEKIQAKTQFDPDVYLVAACIQTRNKILENWDQSCVRPDTFPIDQGTYPIIVLVGPLGSSKRKIAHNIAATIPDKVYLAISHTTRPKHPEEENGVHHYFVTDSEFSALASSGTFVCVTRKTAQNDGLGWAEIAKAVQKNRVCLTIMSLPSALQLYSSRLQPVLILAIPRSEEVHMEMLRMKFFVEFTQNNDEDSVESPVTEQSSVGQGSNGSPMRKRSSEDRYPPPCYCVSSSDMFNMEQYLKKVIASREKYFKMHFENPGLFLKTIYTDEPEVAIEEIKEIIYNQYEHHPSNFPSHPDYHKIISPETLLRRLDAFELEIRIPS